LSFPRLDLSDHGLKFKDKELANLIFSFTRMDKDLVDRLASSQSSVPVNDARGLISLVDDDSTRVNGDENAQLNENLLRNNENSNTNAEAVV
jgi:hypothetical protein